VIPKLVPSSSDRAYFLPIETELSSTRLAIPFLRSNLADHKHLPVEKGVSRTDLVDLSSERRVLTDGHNEDLDGCDRRRQREDSSSFVLLTGPEGVLKQGVEDTTETELSISTCESGIMGNTHRWLNDGRRKGAHF